MLSKKMRQRQTCWQKGYIYSQGGVLNIYSEENPKETQKKQHNGYIPGYIEGDSLITASPYQTHHKKHFSPTWLLEPLLYTLWLLGETIKEFMINMSKVTAPTLQSYPRKIIRNYKNIGQINQAHTVHSIILNAPLT